MGVENNIINKYISGNDGNLSSSIIENWTEQAIECYSINCDCKKCSLKDGNYSFQCQMPKVIDKLITLIGKPKNIPLSPISSAKTSQQATYSQI